MGDIRPKGKVVKTKGGVRQTVVDAGTRDILDMGIGIKPLKSGSGKITKNIQATIAQANAKKP